MDIKTSVAFLLEKVGEEASVFYGSAEKTVNAVIQPMRYKNKLYLDMTWGELGFKDTECFLYLGPPEADFTSLESETFIKTNDRAYCVSRADRITVGGDIVYIWAVLTPRIKENAYDIG